MELERIGVYICHCGTNIAGKVMVEQVRDYAANLRNVVLARDYLYMCSDPGQELITEDIREFDLTRVVVASCSPRMHEKTFRSATLRGGLNPFRGFHMVCIREHCSWVTTDSEEATEKAKQLVRAGVERVRDHQSLKTVTYSVNPNVLIVGGGIAGMQAALDIGKAGLKAYLVERQPTIGGHMLQFDKTFPTLDCASCIGTPKMVAVSQDPNIELFTYSEVEEVSGFIGNYTVKVRRKARHVKEDLCVGCGKCTEKCPVKRPNEWDEGLKTRKAVYTPFPQAVPNMPVIDTESCIYFLKGKCRACEKFCDVGAIDFEQQDRIEEIEVGSIIVATGYDLMDPTPLEPYGYGRYPNVITGLEFERLNNSTGPTSGKILLKDENNQFTEPPQSVAILHCIGSRDENYHEYCSRVCCMYALKFAHLIKDKVGEETTVYNFYIDLRCFGKGYEEFLKRVQKEGVVMIRGKAAQVTDKAICEEEKGKLVVCAEDTLVGEFLRVPVDMVILCSAMEKRSDAEEVARIFGINLGRDGFFLEEHPKLEPVTTATSGVFIAGTCQGPKDIPDTVAQAKAAAAESLALSCLGKVEASPTISSIDPFICTGCRVCIGLCPYSAIEFDERRNVSVINEAMCKGCGSCAAYCPSGAAKVRHFVDRQLFSEIDGLLANIRYDATA